MTTRIHQTKPAEGLSEPLLELISRRTVGVTASAFDLLHPGHVRMFRESRRHLESIAPQGRPPLFLVFLQRDPSVDRPEKNRPVQTFEERFEMVSSLIYVDYIVGYDLEPDLYGNLFTLRHQIAVRFIGEDWKDKPFTGHDLPISLFWNERKHGYSTSGLRDRVYHAEVAKRTALRDEIEFGGVQHPVRLAA